MKKSTLILIAIVANIVPFASLALNFAEKNVVYIYKDDGAGTASMVQTISTLKSILPSNYIVRTINANGVMDNQWIKNAALFVMPGGADLPYVKKLNGNGNKNIKNYVKNGGSYLGICAGSYYGASYVEFDKGGKLEVLGKRELAFFPGKAIGPVLSNYVYNSNSGARAARLYLTLSTQKESAAYYNGGGYFDDAAKYPNVTVIGYYENGLPSIIHIAYGEGNVVLSGVHFEYNPSLFDANDPYLQQISPILKRHDKSRKLLIEEIFRILCISKDQVVKSELLQFKT